MTENNNFKMGIRDGIPICLGYISVSFAFGIFAVGSGLSVLEAALISLFNLTSAGQLAAVPIIAAGGSFIELILTQLVINLRYSLMSVSLSQKLGSSVRTRDRFLMAFANTDEIFAVAHSKAEKVGRRYFFGLMITPILGWTGGTLLGALAGNILPEIVISALGIAIYAMLIAVFVPASRADKNVALCVIISVALSCAFYFVPVLNKVPSGFVIIICSVAASLLFAVVCPVPDEAAEGEVTRDA